MVVSYNVGVPYESCNVVNMGDVMLWGHHVVDNSEISGSILVCKEYSNKQQHIISTNNRKNLKLLDVQITRNIESGQTYTVTGEIVDVGNNNSTKVLFYKTNVNEINNENNILLKEMSYAPVNKNQRGTESESDSPISSKVSSNSTPKAEPSSPNSTPITSTSSSKLLPAQNQSI